MEAAALTLLVITALIPSSSQASSNNTRITVRDTTSDQNRILSYFSKHCSPPNFSRFQAGADRLESCFTSGYREVHTFPNPDKFCDERKKALKHCFYDAVDQMSPCFQEKHAFLTKFLKDLLKSMLKFLCDDDAKRLKGEYFSKAGKQCSEAIVQEEENNNGIDQCFDKMFAPLGPTITQKEICRDLDVVEECTIRYVSKTCPTNSVYKKLSKDFVQSLKEPCGSGPLACQSLIVLLFVSFIIGKFF